MNRQLDDPRFDPANDEWVGAGAPWDQQSSTHSSVGASGGIGSAPQKQKAPAITEGEFEAVFNLLDDGDFAMTYNRCLAQLRKEGQSHLGVDHVALVAELTGIRSNRRRQWTAVPAPIGKLGRALGRERSRRRRKRR